MFVSLNQTQIKVFTLIPFHHRSSCPIFLRCVLPLPYHYQESLFLFKISLLIIRVITALSFISPLQINYKVV